MSESSAEDRKAWAERWLAMLAIGLGVLIATLDVSIVNVSLPTLVTSLDTTFAAIQWVILAYIMVITSLILGAGRLGDMFGKKNLYVWGLGVFTLGSACCGLAPNVYWLIGSRVLQGLGAVFMQGLGSAIIIEVFPPNRRGQALGIIGAILSVGLALGPAIGGMLIGLAGWRSIFLVNLPLGLIAALTSYRYLPSTRPSESGQRFDFVGAVLLGLTLIAYALGMTLGQAQGFGSSLVDALLLGAAVGLGVFIFSQIKLSQPMLDLSLFKNLLFSLNLLMGFLTFVVVAGSFILPFFLELVMHYPPAKTGLMMIVVPLVMGVVAPAAGSLSDRLGPRGISLAGLIVVGIGCLTTGTLTVGVSALGYILRVLPIGIGMGLFVSPNNSAIMGAVPLNRLGVASGLLALSRTLGHSTGIPLVGTLFTALVLAHGGGQALDTLTSAPPEALAAGIRGAYKIGSVLVFLSAALAAAAWIFDVRRLKAEIEGMRPGRS